MSSNVPPTNGKDVALVIAWPESWAKAPEKFFKLLEKIGFIKSRFFQVGHAGMVLINGQTGSVEYFDFGRYTSPKNKGRARSKKTDPKLNIPITAKFDQKGAVKNVEDILLYLDSVPEKTHGDGKMYVSICDTIDFEKCKLHIENLQNEGCQEYRTLKKGSTNCAQFVSDALKQGLHCERTKKRLKYPLTIFRATPIGNVEAVETPINYVVDQGQIYTKKRLNRLGVLKEVFLTTVKNITGKNLTGRFPDNLRPPQRHKKVSPQAQWLPGLGEGTWLTLLPLDQMPNHYRIKGQSAEGETEYDYIAKSQHYPLKPDENYQFVYDCSRLRATILQRNQKIILNFIQDVAVTNPAEKYISQTILNKY